MTLGEMLLGSCFLLVVGFWATLWARLARIEARLERLTGRMGGFATREEVSSIRTDLTRLALIVTESRQLNPASAGVRD